MSWIGVVVGALILVLGTSMLFARSIRSTTSRWQRRRNRENELSKDRGMFGPAEQSDRASSLRGYGIFMMVISVAVIVSTVRLLVS